MITVEEGGMIRERARHGLRITAMAPRVGGDGKTVRRDLADPEPPRYTARPPRVSKLAPCTASGQQRLECGVYQGEVLSREWGARGDDAQKTRRRAAVPPRRRAARPPACGRVETPPGQQGQVAWGHGGTIWHEGHPRRR
jgi:transposase